MSDLNLITNIQIVYSNFSPEFKGYASFVLAGLVKIRDVKLVEIRGKLTLIFPSKERDDKIYDICYPITSEAREIITKAVLEKYHPN